MTEILLISLLMAMLGQIGLIYHFMNILLKKNENNLSLNAETKSFSFSKKAWTKKQKTSPKVNDDLKAWKQENESAKLN